MSAPSPEVVPSLRMVAGLLNLVSQFLRESGCPLTPEQQKAFLEVQVDVRIKAAGLAP